MTLLSNWETRLFSILVSLSAHAASCNSTTGGTQTQSTPCRPLWVRRYAEMTIPLLRDHSTGLLLVEVFIGGPAISQLLIVDTASQWTAIPCYDTRQKNRYIPFKSATSKTRTEKHDFSHMTTRENYVDGSNWSGYLIEEMVGFVEEILNYSSRMVDFTVVCQTDASSHFQELVALGILGLENSPYLLSKVLSSQGVTSQNSFSICVGQTRGFLTFGKLPTERHTSRMQFAPLSINAPIGFYSVEVSSVWWGKACIVSQDVNSDILDRVNAGFGAVIDSGTSDTYFPKQMEKLFSLEWMDGSHQLGNVLLSDFMDLPNIRIVLNGDIELVMPNYQYLRGFEAFQRPGFDTAKRQATLSKRIHFTERRGAVLGLNSFLNREVFFDVENAQVGIAQANCG